MSNFEEWYKGYDPNRVLDRVTLRTVFEAGFREASDKIATLPQRVMFDAGFKRGRKAGLEEAIQILSIYKYNPDLPEMNFYDQIVTAIQESLIK